MCPHLCVGTANRKKRTLKLNRGLLLALWIGATSQAQDFKQRFCESAANRDQAEVIAQSENRIAFKNDGGLLNEGVCWWHSRLQRSATYLAVFRPELPKPDLNQVQKILAQLKDLSSVVEIPGFQNFNEFTLQWHSAIQTFLNQWQLEDGIVYSAWIRGLAGSHQGNPEKLQATLLKVQRQVQVDRRISYLKLKFKKFGAHAWLVYSVESVPLGLKLGVIDSNFLKPVEYLYHWGDPLIRSTAYGDFMPYLEQSDDFTPIERAVEQYCRAADVVDQFH